MTEPATYRELVEALETVLSLPALNVSFTADRARKVLARADTTRAKLERDVVDAAIEGLDAFRSGLYDARKALIASIASADREATE